ncbi:hypothetical protein WJX72_006645 [[Myrmecia] bisecta]|uniref:Mitochondrial carrier protein n=1 Tax=[Myrmecia] bisecta TaxID=41462 RepID=A0AAW1PQD5_9CHLO
MPNPVHQKWPLQRLLEGTACSSAEPDIQLLHSRPTPSSPAHCFASITQATAKAAKEAGTQASSPPSLPDKPAHDVVAGAMARAASQSTIHPLDTMKVRMQTGRYASSSGKDSPPSQSTGRSSCATPRQGMHTSAILDKQGGRVSLHRSLSELKGLYKGVGTAATGAGIIIGAYYAFYSTTKRWLRERTELHEGAIGFLAGATAAVGSSVVKVPLAVCIRSVQAGMYANFFQASSSIVKAAGVRGLFTGFLPTLLEDVPDMAVKFTVYETLRPLHRKVFHGRQPTVVEDLLIGGVAGGVAAAATTPLDVVKTVMMCTASSRPTVVGAARGVMAQGKGLEPFFRGVGPRALSNGLNSAIFFCFFEAIRQVLVKQQTKQAALAAAATSGAAS